MSRQPDNGEVLIESRVLFADCGPESPFILPSDQFRRENRTPPDVQAQETKPASLDSSNSHHRK